MVARPPIIPAITKAVFNILYIWFNCLTSLFLLSFIFFISSGVGVPTSLIFKFQETITKLENLSKTLLALALGISAALLSGTVPSKKPLTKLLLPAPLSTSSPSSGSNVNPTASNPSVSLHLSIWVSNKASNCKIFFNKDNNTNKEADIPKAKSNI